MDQEALAKEALLLNLFRAYPGADKSISRATLDTYLKAIQFFPARLVAIAVEQFITGQVTRDERSRPYAPSADQLATQVRQVRYDEGKTQRFLNSGRLQIEEREKDEHIFKTRTPEQIAKVRRLMDEAKANLAPDVRDEKEQAEIRERLKRADQLFEADYFVTDDGRKVSISLAKQHGIEPYNMEDEEGDIR